ncbi:MAG: aminodeoxychorismate synthase component I [Candidatus Omnitrophota bacterium]|nr:aminodeoxychorismate synthase component I [Candidatus Omnitrophota bacterium]
MAHSVLFETELKKILSANFSSPLVFLETANFDKENKNSFLFNDFQDILTFKYGDDLDIFFEKVENYLRNGFWLCGYFTYEFGYFLEPALFSLRENNKYPLAWLAVCKKPVQINHAAYKFHFEQRNLLYSIKNIEPTVKPEEYYSQLVKIKSYLEEGLTYQVNLTFKTKFDFSGDIIDLYLGLRKAQPTSYMAFINTGKDFILSLSPELFFRIERNKIITKPMKGTIARGLSAEDDEKNKAWLNTNTKIRAENLMIVDLLRNDLGKISKKVWTARLFEIEKYKTLYQMTSTIKAKLKSNIKVKEIFSALFPSGSVTGAPKIKTMQLIKSLEKEPRGIYTGAIGYISPKREMCFNVAIRTVTISDNKGEMGIGGGIVYDSDAKSEYEEALLKSEFLTKDFCEFSLIESLLWQKDKGYFLLDLHLNRLKKSWHYFSIPGNLNKIHRALKSLEKELKKGKFKIRLLLSGDGEVQIEKEPLGVLAEPVKLRISSYRIKPQDIFLYHKTTKRQLYDEELMRARKEGFFEVIFFNTQDEVTEGSFTNVFISKNRRLYTPPIKCGLLGGVLRQYLIEQGQVQEKVLYLKDILSADKLYIGNSVRGLLCAQIFLADSKNKSKIEIQALSCIK